MGFRDFIRMVENRGEKNIEHDMETGVLCLRIIR